MQVDKLSEWDLLRSQSCFWNIAQGFSVIRA